MSYEICLDQFIETIKVYLAASFGIKPEHLSVSMESNLIQGFNDEQYCLSSIDYVELLAYMEEKYDVIFDFDTEIYTVEDLYSYIISSKQNEGVI